jgi:hypothetical protein
MLSKRLTLKEQQDAVLDLWIQSRPEGRLTLVLEYMRLKEALESQRVVASQTSMSRI